MSKTVVKPSAVVSGMQPTWDLIQALMDGTPAMRAASTKYLPKFPNEEQMAYDLRLASSVLFPAYKRTVTTLGGKPFSKPVAVADDLPDQLKMWLQDIDMQGRNLHAFAADSMDMTIGYGFGGILVDYPVANPGNTPSRADGVRTVADETKAGLRPYCVLISPRQVLGWIATHSNGAWTLLQLRFMECVEERDPKDEFTTISIPQVRVLEPGLWRTFRQSPVDKNEWLENASGTTTLDEIPFVPVYGERVAFMVGKPPLIEVAHLNVKHWQSQSDQDTILHVARVPILVARGVDAKNFSLTVGAATCVKFEDSQASLEYVEHTGAAIAAGKISLDDLKEEMRQAGAELLVIQKSSGTGAPVTATQIATENAVGMCALQRITLTLQDALNYAIDLMAEWAKITLPQDFTAVKLFNDFGAATLAEASATILLQTNLAGKLSDETYHSELQRRGILSPDVDWEEEQERIDGQGPPLGTLDGEGNPVDPNAQATTNLPTVPLSVPGRPLQPAPGTPGAPGTSQAAPAAPNGNPAVPGTAPHPDSARIAEIHAHLLAQPHPGGAPAPAHTPGAPVPPHVPGVPGAPAPAHAPAAPAAPDSQRIVEMHARSMAQPDFAAVLADVQKQLTQLLETMRAPGSAPVVPEAPDVINVSVNVQQPALPAPDDTEPDGDELDEPDVPDVPDVINVTVNMPPAPPPPDVTVNVPASPAPIVNVDVQPTQVNVAAPPAPIVNVDVQAPAAPIVNVDVQPANVNVPAPIVNVSVPTPPPAPPAGPTRKEINLKTDDAGNVTGLIVTKQQDGG